MKNSIKKRLVILVVLAAYICLMMGGCANKGPSPEDTIFALQDAINNLDVEALLNCIQSKWANQIRLVLSFFAEDTDTPFYPALTVVKAVMPFLPLVSDGAIPVDSAPSVAFTILETEVEDEEATIDLSGTLSWGEYEETFTATVTLQSEEDTWVITGIR